MSATLPLPVNWLTSTQLGAIGEATIASGLILASKGRLAPFKPFADDDGIDLLIFDKDSRRAIPLQIKCRTKVDNVASETVQFDVRRTTFADTGGGLVVAALLNGVALKTAWLIPTKDIHTVAKEKAEKFVVVASAKSEAGDRCRRYRHDSLESVAQEIIARIGALHEMSPSLPLTTL